MDDATHNTPFRVFPSYHTTRDGKLMCISLLSFSFLFNFSGRPQKSSSLGCRLGRCCAADSSNCLKLDRSNHQERALGHSSDSTVEPCFITVRQIGPWQKMGVEDGRDQQAYTTTTEARSRQHMQDIQATWQNAPTRTQGRRSAVEP